MGLEGPSFAVDTGVALGTPETTLEVLLTNVGLEAPFYKKRTIRLRYRHLGNKIYVGSIVFLSFSDVAVVVVMIALNGGCSRNR